MTDIRVALLGFGNVGRAFAGACQGISIVAVADSTAAICLERPDDLASLLAHKSAGKALKEYSATARTLTVSELLDHLRPDTSSVLVEALPTSLADGQPALDWIRSALLQGISVVTVDKGPMVHGFDLLENAARVGGARLAYRGTAGIWPSGLVAGQEVREIQGVLSGTANYILTEMCEKDLSLQEALEEAEARGIAEPDPRLDLEGWDAAAKILILARTLMKIPANLSDVLRTGIGDLAEELVRRAKRTGCVVRPLARAAISRGSLQLRVAPEIVDRGSPFYAVSGVRKGALFRTVDNQAHFVHGFSGREAIAQVIMEDVRSVARGKG